MTIGQALPLMIDITSGVAELHQAKIVMCDLKPQNVSQCPAVLPMHGGQGCEEVVDLAEAQPFAIIMQASCLSAA